MKQNAPLIACMLLICWLCYALVQTNKKLRAPITLLTYQDRVSVSIDVIRDPTWHTTICGLPVNKLTLIYPKAGYVNVN